MVEMLSAGLSGGPWSLDTADFRSGTASPAVGLTVIAMMPGPAGDDRVGRARKQAARLKEHGVFVPGVSGIEYPRPPSEGLRMPRSVYENITEIAGA
jgi:LDH2 family malate/lactate/ureidoglycolate dehydrogenase